MLLRITRTLIRIFLCTEMNAADKYWLCLQVWLRSLSKGNGLAAPYPGNSKLKFHFAKKPASCRQSDWCISNKLLKPAMKLIDLLTLQYFWSQLFVSMWWRPLCSHRWKMSFGIKKKHLTALLWTSLHDCCRQKRCFANGNVKNNAIQKRTFENCLNEKKMILKVN